MRWIFRILGALVLVVVTLIAALFLLPRERLIAIAAAQVEAQTGRKLEITGDVGISLWPILGMTTGPVRFANAAWAGPEPMLRAEGLAVGLDTGALLRGQIRVRHLEVHGAMLRLATDAAGRGNWEFTPAKAAGTPAPEPSPAQNETRGGFGAGGGMIEDASLDLLRLTAAQVRFDGSGQPPVILPMLDAELRWPDQAGPLHLKGSLRQGAEDVSISAEIDSFAQLLAGEVSPLRAQIGAAGADFRLDGRGDMAGNLAAQISLDAPDTRRLLRLAGQGGIDIPRGLGRGARMAAAVTLIDATRLSLRELALQLDGNALRGAADVDLSASPPRLTAQIDAGALDLSGLVSGGAAPRATTAPKTAQAGWSTDPIDASALGLIDGRIALTAASVDLDMLKLGPSRLSLAIERARAVLDIAEVTVFGGAIRGELVANNRSGLSVGGDLRADGIGMTALLGTLIGFERLSGAAAARLKFLGIGNSQAAILRSLSGQGGIEMARGVISGIDLDQLMRSGQVGGGTTVFDSLSATFTIDKGVLRNDDLAVALANFRAEGAGNVGLYAQDIDYLFIPIALRANSGQGLAIPIRIRGPWSGPRILPDLKEAIRLDSSGKVKEIEDRARAKVEEKLQQELGVSVREGQSLEDAAKEGLQDKLESEAKRGLLRLLGRE